MRYIGIDGCKGGWFAVALESCKATSWQMELITQLTEISGALKQANLVLIDIPIGMRSVDCKERKCDLEARKVLSPLRHSSVFPVPCRKALKMETYTEASAMNFGCTGRKLSRQTWNIMPKIREVDLYIRRRKLHGRIREMHPEVVFWALNNKQPMEHPKRTDEGFDERVKVLEPVYPHVRKLLESFFTSTNYGQGLVARDDVLDALAGAVTASFKPRLKTLPERPDIDCRGLAMEYVYPVV